MKELLVLVGAFLIMSCASSPNLKPQTQPQRIVSGESCSEILSSGKSTKDGIHMIDPDGPGGNPPFKAYCDMSHEGGGWTLYAHHSDGLQRIEKKGFVDKANFGVLENDRWRVLRDNMTTGMMFLDEHGRVSTMSLAKLNAGNCTSIGSVSDLSHAGVSVSSGAGGIWHNENSGCLITGSDYSMVQLRGQSYKSYNIAGAALYQESALKFTKWSYNRNWSYDDQNTLLYFIK